MKVFELLELSPEVLVEASEVPDSYSFAGLSCLSSIVHFDVREDSADTWRSTLEKSLPTNWTTAFVNGLMPDRSLSASLAGQRQRGAAALLYALLDFATPGDLVVAIVPAALFTSRSTAVLREWMWANHQPTWLLNFSNRQRVLGVHSALELALLVVRAGPAPANSTRIVRLVDLDGTTIENWGSEIVRARQREGGESGRSIVLRHQELGREAWTYQRFSRAFREVVEDVRGLGDLVKLGDLATEIGVGLSQQELGEAQVELDLFTEVEGGIRCFAGCSTRDGELSGPHRWVKSEAVAPGFHLRAGDILVRRIVGLRADQCTNLSALVRNNDLPAVFDHTLIRIRPKPEVSATTIELLVSFMNSKQFGEMLKAAGQGLMFSRAAIAELEVPLPSAEVLRAFERLAKSEQTYEGWARECRATRSSVISASSYRSAVEALLAQERVDYERATAAAASQTFEYRIQNYFPYPIALRRELLRQREHGKERIDGTLACAEHAMNLLAFASMLQISPEGGADSLPSSALRSTVRDAALSLDWGKAEAVLREGLNFARRANDILSLPFPELASLDDAFFGAETWLRNLRNGLKHLEERPPSQVEQLSREATEHLDSLLQGLESLIMTPLVVVDDYYRDPISGERHGVFRRLQGVSQAFPVERRVVDSEIPRNAVGFVVHAGQFRTLAPWLLMETCPTCQREELFAFSKYARGQAKYLAMETGHASPREDVGGIFARLVEVE